MSEQIEQWIGQFGLADFLQPHVATVISNLPAAVRDDLMQDAAFTMCDYDPTPRLPFRVPVGLPMRGKPARSVVLKRTLVRRSDAFIRWLIAHELAHAHLRHGGRWPAEDPELAADALAAAWGFPRPVQ